MNTGSSSQEQPAFTDPLHHNTENRSHFKSVRSVFSMKMDMRCESLSIHKSNEKYSSGLRSEVYGLISLR